MLTVLIAQLLSGIVLIARHNLASKQKAQIIFVLSFWASVMLWFLISNMTDVVDGDFSFEYNVGICNMDLILSGLLSFFVLVSYPFAVFYSKILRIRTMLIILSPLLTLIFAYFLWHAVVGADPFVVYPTFDVLLQNIATMPVIMRLLIVVAYVVYAVFIFVNMWRIVPIYNELTKGHYSKYSYNINWIKIVTIFYILISLSVFLQLFIKSRYLNMAYLIAFNVAFFYIIEKTLLSKAFEDLNKLGLKWSIKQGWHYLLIPNTPKRPTPIDINVVAPQIDKWMRSKRPYTHTHFTSENIIDHFPGLTTEDLRKIFKRRGTTLHAYIREYRIRQACHIIESHSQDTNLKEVYSAVGFSHYSSFARAFVQLVGMSPTDYIQQQNQKATRL